MKAEIITIGDELLIGQTIDTNSAWIGWELSSAGFDVRRRTSIHDNRDEILNALSEAAERKPELVIITGGLGPTSDDITKQTLCEFFNTKLVPDREVLEMIEKMLRRRNFPMNENNRRQAEVPESCRVLPNAAGTAPGMWFEKDGTIFISMPGVPGEMKYIMQEHVLPDIKKRFRSQVIIHKNIMTYGMPEARLAEILEQFEAELPENIKLAYLPSFGVIKLRLTGTAGTLNEIEPLIGAQTSKLYNIIPDLIFGEDEQTPEMAVGQLLKIKKLTLSLAESCTGGFLAHRITSVAGSSEYFAGSLVAYSNNVKTGILGIDPAILASDGAVSSRVAAGMAEGARKLFKTDLGLATTGIAGPSGGSADKPVGMVWIAVSSDSGTITEKHIFSTDRIANITRFSLAAMNLLRLQIINR
ncbi:MAG: competence/damage-inducible protein A [Bacteroidales bacterium]|mgnify:CR=1 FL=1|nr:competence/damage-inducible protein A [Bacteroidales bacterium]HPM17376.1 competence/damage-inducible protein A [Bacteroidales bacterium]